MDKYECEIEARACWNGYHLEYWDYFSDEYDEDRMWDDFDHYERAGYDYGDILSMIKANIINAADSAEMTRQDTEYD